MKREDAGKEEGMDVFHLDEEPMIGRFFIMLKQRLKGRRRCRRLLLCWGQG